MEIIINVDVLSRHNLSLSEYVYLKAIYEERPKEDMLKIYSCIDRIEEDSLQDRGFIKILEDNEVILRDQGVKLFDSGNLFLKFLATFPIKTPSRRYLSPAGTDGILVKQVEKKWNTLFKNKPHKEEKAIAVLEAELQWRRQTNQLEYMNNVNAWLHQANYEKFEHLLEEYGKKEQSFNDFM